MIRLAALPIAVLLAVPLRADLSAVEAERNPEKRAEKALDNADAMLKSAEQSYRGGKLDETNAALSEVSQSVVLAYDSLLKTGKNPSRSPKHFKRAEIRTRELLRRLGDFREQMSAMDRDEADKVRASVQKVHEDLLDGIMAGKKRTR